MTEILKIYQSKSRQTTTTTKLFMDQSKMSPLPAWYNCKKKKKKKIEKRFVKCQRVQVEEIIHFLHF